VSRKDGFYARRLPEDLRIALEDWRADVIAAQGGLDELEREPIRAGLVKSLINAETAERLTMGAIVRAGGVESRAGRELLDRLYAAIDRKLRLSIALGLSRRQKPAGSLAEQLAAIEQRGGVS